MNKSFQSNIFIIFQVVIQIKMILRENKTKQNRPLFCKHLFPVCQAWLLPVYQKLLLVTGSKDQKNAPLVSHLLNFLSLTLVILLTFPKFFKCPSKSSMYSKRKKQQQKDLMRSGTVILTFLPLQRLPFEYQIKFYDYSDYFFYPHRILKRVFISIIVQYTQFCSLFLPVHTGNHQPASAFFSSQYPASSILLFLSSL